MIAKVQDSSLGRSGPRAVGEKAAKVVRAAARSTPAPSPASRRTSSRRRSRSGGKGEPRRTWRRAGGCGRTSGIMSAGGVWKSRRHAISASEGLNALGAILAGQTASSRLRRVVRRGGPPREGSLRLKMSCATGDGQAAYTATLAKLVNDAKIHAEVFRLKLLGSIIAVPISEIVNPMIEEAAEPVQDRANEALSPATSRASRSPSSTASATTPSRPSSPPRSSTSWPRSTRRRRPSSLPTAPPARERARCARARTV